MIKYRSASLSDFAELKALEQAVIEAERPFNEQITNAQTHYYDLRSLIESEQSELVVAECEDRLVGSGYVLITDSKHYLRHQQHGYLGFMYVAPEFRGKGVNKHIMDRLIEWGRQKGIEDFYLDVYSQNAAAVRAYQKAGFTENILEMKLHV